MLAVAGQDVGKCYRDNHSFHASSRLATCDMGSSVCIEIQRCELAVALRGRAVLMDQASGGIDLDNDPIARAQTAYVYPCRKDAHRMECDRSADQAQRCDEGHKCQQYVSRTTVSWSRDPVDV